MPENSQPLARSNGGTDGWQTILIPEISLTCGMSKTTVSIAELTVLGDMKMNGTLNPTIQIWRQSNEDNNQYSFGGNRMIDLRLNSDTECKLIQENQVGALRTESAATIFQCTVTVNFDKDLKIQRRDILGIGLPPKPDTTFEILFNFNNSNLSNYVFPGKYSHPHTLNLNSMNFTDSEFLLNQQPQINIILKKNPGK